jgi:hypothetical protein
VLLAYVLRRLMDDVSAWKEDADVTHVQLLQFATDLRTACGGDRFDGLASCVCRDRRVFSLPLRLRAVNACNNYTRNYRD